MDNESCRGKSSQIYLCNENEIPLFREFPFLTTNTPLSECLSGIHLLLSGTISEEALITRYFGTIETCERFQVNLSIRSDEGLTLETSVSLSLHCGNFTLINSFDAKFGCFTFPPSDTAISFETNRSSL